MVVDGELLIKQSGKLSDDEFAKQLEETYGLPFEKKQPPSNLPNSPADAYFYCQGVSHDGTEWGAAIVYIDQWQNSKNKIRCLVMNMKVD